MDLAFPAIDGYREISIAAGVLYLLVFVAGVLSIAHAVDDPDYLNKASRNSHQIKKAACFQFLMAIFYLSIPIVLYPVLEVWSESLALGFLSFRIITVVFVLTGTVMLLMLLKLSQDYSKDDSADLSSYQQTGNLLKRGRDLVNHVGMVIPLCIGAMLLYTIMLQSGLIPVWLSVWGLIGASISILASMLVMIKYTEIITPLYVALNIPIALQEIVFAVWLIVKGFDQV